MDEAVSEGWSSHQLQRQISVLYYERMLASKDKNDTRNDARANIAPAYDGQEIECWEVYRGHGIFIYHRKKAVLGRKRFLHAWAFGMT